MPVIYVGIVISLRGQIAHHFGVANASLLILTTGKNIMRAMKIGLACVAVLVATAGTSQAALIVSNVGDSGTHGWGIAHSFWSAARFTTNASDYSLDNVVVRMSNADVRSDVGIFAAIYSDSLGTPGNLLGSILTTATDVTSTVGLITFTPSGTAASLLANTDYWVVVGQNSLGSNANPGITRTGSTGSGPGTMHLDIWSTTNQGGSWAIEQSASASNFTFIHEVNATPEVPEPGSIIAMLSLASFGAGAVVVRRRKAKKLAA